MQQLCIAILHHVTSLAVHNASDIKSAKVPIVIYRGVCVTYICFYAMGCYSAIKKKMKYCYSQLNW